MLASEPLSFHEKDIEEIFFNPDLSLIKSVIYFDNWTTYEESGGYLIFYAIDDTIQKVEYGYSVMAEDHNNYWELQEISEDTAKRLIENMNELIVEQLEGMI